MTASPGALVYLHLPKTGGTTLRAIILAQEQHTNVLEMYEGDSVERFKARDQAERDRADVVVGHVQFGIHRYMRDDTRYVTVVRNPVDRAISNHAFIQSRPEHARHELAMSLSFADYVRRDGQTGLDNAQVRALTRLGAGAASQKRPVGRADFDEAIENLEEHFALAGVTERFDDTLAALAVIRHWSAPRYLVRNVTPKRRSAADLTPEERAAVEESEQWDFALHAWASERLDAIIDDQGSAHVDMRRRIARANGPTWRAVRRVGTVVAGGRRRLLRR